MYTTTKHGRRALRPSAQRRALRIAGAATVPILVGGMAAIIPVAANAETRVVSSAASGTFLGGSILGTDLDTILRVEAAQVENDGSADSLEHRHPLTITALDALTIPLPDGLALDLGDFLEAGAVPQYASAANTGDTFGLSGALADHGGLAVGGTGSTGDGSLAIDLDELLGAEFAESIADLSLQLRAIGATAEGDITAATGDYTIAGANVVLTSPLLGSVLGSVPPAVGDLQDEVNQLGEDDGPLVLALEDVLASANPLLSVVGGNADVSVDLAVDLQAAVSPLLTGTLSGDGVTIDLTTGTITIDLAAITGELNNLAPNTELLTDEVVGRILTNVTGLAQSFIDQILQRVNETLNAAHVEIRADVSVLNDLSQEEAAEVLALPGVDGLLDQLGLGGIVDQVLGGTGAGSVENLVDDLLGGVTGPITGGASGGVSGGASGGGTSTGGSVGGSVGGSTGGLGGLLDQVVGGLLGGLRPAAGTSAGGALLGGLTGQDLRVGVDVDIVGSLAQILAGTAPEANVNATVAGLQVPISTNAVLGGVGGALQTGLFSNEGAVQGLVDDLNTQVLQPVVQLATGDNGLGELLNDVVSLQVNVQEVQGPGSADDIQEGTTFRQTALRITVLPGLTEGDGEGSLATLNVAEAEVTPILSSTVTPPGGGGEDDGDDDGNGGGGSFAAVDGGGSLAYTGFSIWMLLMLLLSLLAGGGYLVYRSHLRSRPIVAA